MATISFTVQTDDGTTVNASHSVALSDTNLSRFLTAMAATYAPGASNAQLITMWVSGNMARANTFVTSYEASQVAAPNSVSYVIT